MAKRPSMEDVTNRLREQSAAQPMKAPKPVAEIGAPVALASEVTPSRSHVRTLPRQVGGEDVPKGFNIRPMRIEKPHQSIYAHPNVFRELRKIASAEEIKPQDLYREGLRAVFKARGLDFDKLDRGEV